MAITLREFFVRIYRRSFLIGSLMGPLILLIWIFVPALLLKSSFVERKVEVLDQSGDPSLFKALEEKVRTMSQGTRFILTQRVVAPDEDIDQLRHERDAQLAQNPNLAVIVLRPGVLEDAQPEYYAKNMSDTSLGSLSQTVGSAMTARRLMKVGFDPEKIDYYTRNANLKMIKVTGEGETQQRAQDFILPLVLFFLMFIAVSGYGQRVMMGMLDEKESKVIEIIVSSVKPFHLMMGKLIGIGLVGLTQLLIWLAFAIGLKLFTGKVLSSQNIEFSGIPTAVVIAFFIYFVLGYFMFGTIYSIVGAMISRPEDIVAFQRPLTLINLVPLFTVWIVMRDPSSPLSVILSMIPLFSPTLMLLRVVVISPPIWEIVLSVLFLLVTIIIAIWFAAKVYRVRILLYGKRPTLAQIGRWLKYA